MNEAYNIELANKCAREALNLGLAKFMMDNRVAKIMHSTYREEEKLQPDEAYLAALDVSHSAVWNDRHAMTECKPDIVEIMIEKYTRLRDEKPTVYE